MEEGLREVHNPWINWAPFSCAKERILLVNLYG